MLRFLHLVIETALTLFEKTPLDQLLKNTESTVDTPEINNQLNLFN